MSGLALWRGVYLQTVMICGLCFLAWKAPEIRLMVIPILAGMATHMAAKSKNDASTYFMGGGSDGGTSLPPPSLPTRSMTPIAGTPIPRVDKKVLRDWVGRWGMAGAFALVGAMTMAACNSSGAP